MNKLFEQAKLWAAVGLVVAASGCAFLSKSACKLTEADGKNILGTDVAVLDKYSRGFGPLMAKSEKFRGCVCVSKKPKERGDLRWIEAKTESAQKAKMFFESSEMKTSDAVNFRVETVEGIGEEAKLFRYETKRTNELGITVRKGRILFYITVSKPSASEIPVEQVKSLASRIADETND